VRLTLDCLPCLLRQAVHVARMCTRDDGERERIVRRALGHLAGVDMDLTPPEATTGIYDIVRDVTGVSDPYAGVKRSTNAAALGMLEGLRGRVEASDDPFAAAVRIALAGNIIDFGASQHGPPDVAEDVETCLVAAVHGTGMDAAREAVRGARSILYVCDNAGEIVFDRVLVERIGPSRVVVAVRGAPCINDATMQDAREAGLADLVRVVDTGSDVPGAPPARCGPAFREALAAADLVISKGQGNYETLAGVDRPVLFVLRAKCEVVARRLGVEQGAMVLELAGPAAPV
jgi:uncharacterized protein with ATP-grasp and redox domains